MRYYLREKGRTETGPFAWNELRPRLRSGALADTAVVREETGTEWLPIRALAARQGRRDEERSRHTISEAMDTARRKARQHFVSGGAALALGLLASCICFAAGLVAGTTSIVFVGLIAVGLVQIGRGFAARP